MYVESVKLIFRIGHANSLKDKRRVARSLIDKTRHKFNASVAEIDSQDLHQILTIGIAVVSGNSGFAECYLDDIVRFLEGVADGLGAEIIL